jgi:allantoate deiminase
MITAINSFHRPAPQVLGKRAFALLHELASFTDEPGKMTRLYLSPAHALAADWVKQRFETAGMSAHIDPLGSVIGRYEGLAPGLPALMLGSHIDTVKDAGIYDGNLGVIAGLMVVECLHSAGLRLPFALEVAAFGDEENVRFPTNLSTSQALAGKYDPAWLTSCDTEGISVAEALIQFGGDPQKAVTLGRDPASLIGYLELHIEQGPVLEAEGEALGVVTAINAQRRARIHLKGEAGHAGTVPMNLRRDALAAACEMALVLESVAARHPDAVGTVGMLMPDPGAANVIPGEARFSVDYRAPLSATVEAMERELDTAFADIAKRRGIALSVLPVSALGATPMSRHLQAALATGVTRAGANTTVRHLPSGAGHDAMAMSQICPSAMLFVRCAKGISHSPLESMTQDDVGLAVRALLETVLELAATSG